MYIYMYTHYRQTKGKMAKKNNKMQFNNTNNNNNNDRNRNVEPEMNDYTGYSWSH
jgi:hypothetical protein